MPAPYNHPLRPEVDPTMNRTLAAGLVSAVLLTGAGLADCSGGDSGKPDASPSVSGAPASTAPDVPPGGLLEGPAAPYDINGDGTSDLVVTDSAATVDRVYSAGYAAVLPGGRQGLDLAHSQAVTQNGIGQGPAGQGGDFGHPSVSADLDGDGYADLVTQAGSQTVFVVWGGPGRLHASARLSGRAPLTGDFDGDGHADLVVASPPRFSAGARPYSATILYGPFSRSGKAARSSDVRFPVEQPAGEAGFFTAASPVAVCDFDGDGRDDLVVTWYHVFGDEFETPRATAVYLGSASGVGRYVRLEDAHGADLYSGSFDRQIATGDVNRDGHGDVVIGLPSDEHGDDGIVDPEGGTRLTVAYGAKSGTPRTQVITARTPGLPGSPAQEGFGGGPAVADVDGDGYADVAFSGGTADHRSGVWVLRGGRQGLTTAHAQLVTGHAGELALMDVTGDHRAELMVGLGLNHGDGLVVMRGTATGVDAARPRSYTSADVPGLTATGGGFGSGFGR